MKSHDKMKKMTYGILSIFSLSLGIPILSQADSLKSNANVHLKINQYFVLYSTLEAPYLNQTFYDGVMVDGTWNQKQQIKESPPFENASWTDKRFHSGERICIAICQSYIKIKESIV